MKKIAVILLPVLLGLCFAFIKQDFVLSHTDHVKVKDGFSLSDQRVIPAWTERANHPNPKPFVPDQLTISLMDSTLCNGFDFPVNENNMYQWTVNSTDSF